MVLKYRRQEILCDSHHRCRSYCALFSAVSRRSISWIDYYSFWRAYCSEQDRVSSNPKCPFWRQSVLLRDEYAPVHYFEYFHFYRLDNIGSPKCWGCLLIQASHWQFRAQLFPIQWYCSWQSSETKATLSVFCLLFQGDSTRWSSLLPSYMPWSYY